MCAQLRFLFAGDEDDVLHRLYVMGFIVRHVPECIVCVLHVECVSKLVSSASKFLCDCLSADFLWFPAISSIPCSLSAEVGVVLPLQPSEL